MSEEHATTEVTTMSSPMGNTLGTVIKPDPGSFITESSNPLRVKQHSSDSELQRGSSHESMEGESSHQITLVNIFNFEIKNNLKLCCSFNSKFPSKICRISLNPLLTSLEQHRFLKLNQVNNFFKP